MDKCFFGILRKNILLLPWGLKMNENHKCSQIYLKFMGYWLMGQSCIIFITFRLDVNSPNLRHTGSREPWTPHNWSQPPGDKSPTSRILSCQSSQFIVKNFVSTFSTVNYKLLWTGEGWREGKGCHEQAVSDNTLTLQYHISTQYTVGNQNFGE